MSLLILPFLFPTLPFISLPLIFHNSIILLVSHSTPHLSSSLSFKPLPSFLFPSFPFISLPPYLSHSSTILLFSHSSPHLCSPLSFKPLASFLFPTSLHLSSPLSLHLYHPSYFPLFPSSLFPLIFHTSTILLVSHSSPHLSSPYLSHLYHPSYFPLFPSSLFPISFTPLPSFLFSTLPLVSLSFPLSFTLHIYDNDVNPPSLPPSLSA